MKIAIVGSHPDTRDLAPFHDEAWEIWACSTHNCPPHFTMPRVTRFYEVHVPALDPTRPQDYLDFVRQQSKHIPTYMMDRSGHPDALPYPKDEIEDEFGPFFLDTSSIAYMIAHAIKTISSADVDDHWIGIFGVMQKSATEYGYQRPGIQFFIQAAVDRGINVVVPSDSAIMRPIRYKF